MAQTPISQASSYLPASEFLKRYDWRTVGDLCSDTNTRPAQGDLTNTGTAAGANLQSGLDDGSGMIESAAFAKGRYSADDLMALTGVGQKLLYRINADLTIGLLIQRRPDKKISLPPQHDVALEFLKMLFDGERIFSFNETQQAGIPPDVSLETQSDVYNRYLVTTQARALFGRRSNADGSFPLR